MLNTLPLTVYTVSSSQGQHSANKPHGKRIKKQVTTETMAQMDHVFDPINLVLPQTPPAGQPGGGFEVLLALDGAGTVVLVVVAV
jgi:hypothetical protein